MIRGLLFLFVLLGWSLPSAHAQEATPPADDGPACVREATEEERTALPEWMRTDLTDAATGETFQVADYLGCTVLVENMATWCHNCLEQLGNLKAALPDLDPDQHVIIAISVETDLDPEQLVSYAEDNEFPWSFSVGSPDLLKLMVDEFGREVLVPPSTPHVFINPDGTYDDLITGFTSTEDLIEKFSSEQE